MARGQTFADIPPKQLNALTIMADDTSSLDILIRTLADTNGIDELQKSLDRAKTSTQDLGEQTEKGGEEAANSLDRAKTSAQDLGEQTEKAGEGVGSFNVQGREMRRLIMEMDRVVPGLGLALRAAFRPETLGIAAVILLVQLLVKHFQAAQKAAEESAKAAADGWAAHNEAARDAAEESRKAADVFEQSMKRGVDATKSLTAEFAGQKKILDALIESRDKLLGGGKGGTEDQAAKLRLEDEAAKLRLQQGQAMGLQVSGHGLDQAAQAAQAAYQAALKSPQAIGQKAALGGQDEAKLKETADKAGTVTDWQKKIDAARLSPGMESQPAYIAALEAKQHEAKQAQDALKVFELNKAAVAAHTESLEKLKKANDEATEAAKRNREAVDKMTADVETAKRILQIHKQADLLSHSSDIIGGGTKALEDARKGQYSKEDAAAVSKLSELSKETGFGSRGLFDAINKLIDLQRGTQGLLNAVNGRISTLTEQMQNMRNHVAG